MDIREKAFQFLNSTSLKQCARELSQLIEPSIQIKTYSKIVSSQSHFGGLPEVPHNFKMPVWNTRPYLRSELQNYKTNPELMEGYRDSLIAQVKRDLKKNTIEPLTYLGQIHLDELPASPAADKLPKTGVLYFFYDLENSSGGYSPSSRESWRCLYSNCQADDIAPVSNNNPNLQTFPRCSLTFEHQWMFIDLEFDDRKIEQYHITEQEKNEVIGALIDHCDLQLSDYGTEHRLLGHSGIIQNPMERQCQLNFYNIEEQEKQSEAIENGVKDWQLLLQIDSDDNVDWCFGSGRIYFWIRRQDLEKHDFSNVWFFLQAT